MDNSCCQAAPVLRALSAASEEPAPRETAFGLRETVFEIEGATCGACVLRIEAALREVPGVASAVFNLASRRARVTHGEGVALESLEAAVAAAGYRVAGSRAAIDPARARRTTLWRTGLAGFAMMQVMMLAFPAYVADEGTLAWDHERLLALASLVITMPVLAFSAAPIWAAAWHGLRSGHPGMDVPVALGLVAAFGASLPNTFLGGAVYYDAITMFVFFLSLARAFEARALAATIDSTEALAKLLPRKAARYVDGAREEIDCEALQPGDLVGIGTGEAAPADCELGDGRADFNEAWITGESAPVSKRPGDVLLAGSVNLGAPVRARVLRSGEDQTLALVRRLVDRAAAHKPRWAMLADRIAPWFVAGVLLVAASAGLAWFAIDPARALPVAMAVLVVSCPCALSLAAPVALTAGASALAARGVLVTRGSAVESLAAVDHVVFDKTGTLTTGRFRIASLDLLAEVPRERCLAIAAALEQAMPHPVAHALAAAAAPAGVTQLVARPGSGVEALVEGVRHRIGTAAYCGAIAGSAAPGFDGDDGSPLVLLAREGAWLARFRFDDTPRPEAPEALRRLLALGCRATLLSGDRGVVVARVARSLGVEDAYSGASPQDKLRIVEGFVAAGDTVAMVGDGVNDAPPMAAAHVAIAIGQGAALAQSQADLVLLNPSLTAIPAAIELARRTRRIVAQNLVWAAAYNAVTLPLAVSGLLVPWMASLGMSLSSLLVVLNALRLARRPA